jgi:polar amino acid transport system substrate-binding protein
MHKSRIYFALIALLSVPLFSFGETLRLVANIWEPFTGEQLPYDGLATEIVTTALKRAGYETEVRIKPWPRALQDVYLGKAAGIVAIWSTPERQKHVLLSKAYYTNKMVLLTRRDNPIKAKTLSDLTGKRIGVGRQYDYNEEFMNAQNFVKEPADNLLSNLNKMTAGRIDLILEEERIANFYLSTHWRDINNYANIAISADTLFKIPLFFGISRAYPNHQAIISKFNTALQKMEEDGSLRAILEKHDQIENSPKTQQSGE